MSAAIQPAHLVRRRWLAALSGAAGAALWALAAGPAAADDPVMTFENWRPQTTNWGPHVDTNSGWSVSDGQVAPSLGGAGLRPMAGWLPAGCNPWR